MSNISDKASFLHKLVTEDWVGFKKNAKNVISWKPLSAPDFFSVELDPNDPYYKTVIAKWKPVKNANGYIIEWNGDSLSLGEREDTTMIDTVYGGNVNRHNINWDYDLSDYYFHALAFDNLKNESGWTEVKKPIINGQELMLTSSIDKDGNKIPQKFWMSQIYPNPFNPEATINFTLPKSFLVTLKVFNVIGEEVVTLVDEYKKTGYYSVNWRGIDSYGQYVTSGIYFYIFRAGSYLEIRKCVLLR